MDVIPFVDTNGLGACVSDSSKTPLLRLNAHWSRMDYKLYIPFHIRPFLVLSFENIVFYQESPSVSFFFSFLQRFFPIFLSSVCLHILLLLSPIFPFSWFFLFKPYFRSLVFWVMLDVRAVEAAGHSSAQTRGSCWVPVWGWRSLSHQQPVFPVAAAGK